MRNFLTFSEPWVKILLLLPMVLLLVQLAYNPNVYLQDRKSPQATEGQDVVVAAVATSRSWHTQILLHQPWSSSLPLSRPAETFPDASNIPRFYSSRLGYWMTSSCSKMHSLGIQYPNTMAFEPHYFFTYSILGTTPPRTSEDYLL
jgi:hypothetical protein